MLRVETWKHGWRWVYSVTYDEGVHALLEHALPLHVQHAIPGTIAVDADRLAKGEEHRPDVDGGAQVRYLNLNEIHELQRHGWGIAGLGPTREQARDGDRAPTRGAPALPNSQTLEDVVGTPVTALAVLRQNHHHGFTPEEIQEAGYLSVFTLEDRLNFNHVDEDLNALGRAAMYTVESTVLPLRVYDPYWRLHQAWDTGGWLVDSARVVSESPADPERNITPALLAERFEKVAEVGDVWRATPDEVIDYILTRRAAHPRALHTTDEAITFHMEAPRIPERVQSRELTFTLDTPRAWHRPVVTVDGTPITGVTALTEDRMRFTLPVHDGQQMRISKAVDA